MSDPVARLREHLDAGERLDLINGDDLRALLDRLDAAEALLSGYRSAVSFIGADSWDGCSDCIEVLQQAAAADIERPHSPDEIAMGLGLLRLSTVGLLAASEARATALQTKCEALEAALRGAYGRGDPVEGAWSAEALRLPEDGPVRQLCERHGYGAVMDSASRQWLLKDPLGAFLVGTCAATYRAALEVKP